MCQSAYYANTAVLPQTSLQKSLDSQKDSLDLILLPRSLQCCLKRFNYLLYRPKAFESFASFVKIDHAELQMSYQQSSGFSKN